MIAQKIARINVTEPPPPREKVELVAEVVVETTVQETVQEAVQPESELAKKDEGTKIKAKKPSRIKK